MLNTLVVNVNHANINNMLQKLFGFYLIQWYLVDPLKSLFKKTFFYFFKRAVYRKIRQANEERKLTGYKCYVVKVGGWPMVVKKKDLKLLLARKRFKKGTTIQQIEKSALYVTN